MNKRYRIMSASLLTAVSLGISVQAEEADMVITATRTTISTADAGSAISVITRSDIDKSKKTSVLDVLRGQSGLEVVQGGGPGNNASVFIRGASSAQTLILVDGMRVNSPSSGGFDLSDLTLESIDRIEVLRGAQSTLYGSDAMGGVINIITQRGSEETETWARAQGGSLGHGGAAAGVRGTVGGFDISASVSWEDWDSVSGAAESNGNSEEDNYENLNAAIQAGTTFMDDGELILSLRSTSSETDLDGFEFGSGPVDDLNYRSDRDSLQARATARKPLTDSIDQTIEVGIYDDDREGIDPDTAFNNFEINTRVIDVNIQTDISGADDDILSIGYAFQKQEAENVGNFDEDTDINSVFLQHQFNVGEDMRFTAGTRFNDHSEFGDKTTYRATWSWTCPDRPTRVHASVGSGFRAPTLNDLYFPGFGNLDLDPETSVGWDIGIEKVFMDERLIIDVTWFANDFEDLISFDDATFTAVNVDEAESSGIEASARYAVSDDLSLAVNHTYTDTEDKATGMQLARRPEQRTVVSADYAGEAPLTASLSVLAVNDRINSDGSDMDDYTRVDLAITYTGMDTIEPFVRIDNVFDEDYEEVSGFTTPGVVAVGGVKARW